MSIIVKEVEAVERRYEGGWVKVRGVEFGKGYYGKHRYLRHTVEGVSVRGYGKLHRDDCLERLGVKDIGIRYMLGGVYREVTEEDIKDCDTLIVREVDPRYLLTGVYDAGIRYEREVREYGTVWLEGVEVITREGLEYLMTVERFRTQGFQIAKEISFAGIVAKDFLCLDYRGVIDITEEQALQVDWGEVEELETFTTNWRMKVSVVRVKSLGKRYIVSGAKGTKGQVKVVKESGYLSV